MEKVSEKDLALQSRESPFFKLLGFEKSLDKENEVMLHLNIEEKHLNVNCTLHGGVHAAMIDNILGAALFHVTKIPSTTITLNIHYLAPVHTGRITAAAKILQLGYKTAAVEGAITDKKGTMIAKGTGTFKLFPKKILE